MERIIHRVNPQKPEAALQRLNDFITSIEGLPIAEAEQKIAEEKFRKPITLGSWAIRQVWKDFRKTPPLFSKKPIPITGDKAMSYMARGH